jgi:GNAT superfamily N-acetyltransferase
VIEIRPATSADAMALAELRWEFRAGREPAVEGRDAFVERCAAWMRAQLETGIPWRAWVAEERRRLVGHVWLHTIDKVPNPNGNRERHAYLSNLYVTPASRGTVGTRLLETAVEWASANGVDHVILWPTMRSRTLYARHGFTVSGDFLNRPC